MGVSSCSLGTIQNHNRIEGKIPNAISHLRVLKQLSLSENKLTGAIPGPSLNRLVHLEKLLLSSNKLTGRIPWEINDLANLAELSVTGNQMMKESEVMQERRQKQLPNCLIRY